MNFKHDVNEGVGNENKTLQKARAVMNAENEKLTLIQNNFYTLKRLFFLCHMNEPYSINDIKIFNKVNNNNNNNNDNNDIIKMDMDIHDKIINYIKFIKDNDVYKRSFLSQMLDENNNSVLDEIFIAITFMYIYQYIDNHIGGTHGQQFTIQRNIFDSYFRKYCNNQSKKKTEPPYIKNILKSARDVLYEEVEE
jgi:hypothetical protein